MQTVQIDADNNLIIVNGSLKVIDGVEACAQDTKTRVGLCQGENPFDTTEGIDYFNNILGKIGGFDYVREAVRKRILANDEIVQIESLNVTYNNRQLDVLADVSSIYGVFEL